MASDKTLGLGPEFFSSSRMHTKDTSIAAARRLPGRSAHHLCKAYRSRTKSYMQQLPRTEVGLEDQEADSPSNDGNDGQPRAAIISVVVG